MLTDIDKEFDTPIEDENGELIETIEEDDVFIEEDLGLEEQPDSFYEVEDDIVIEGEEEEEIYSIQEVTVEAKENYENVKEQLVAIFTSILEKGEITAEDNIEIEQLKEEYTQAYNDIKENVEGEQNKALEERVQELEDGMVGSRPDEILAILTDNGRKPWLYTDEDNNVLMDGTAIPELTVLAQKLSLIATDGDDESSIVLTPTMIQMIAESDIQLSAKKILINGLLEGKGWRVTEEGILDIKELNAVKATIGTLEAGEIIADIIHGNTADIGNLSADIGEIQTLVGENLTMKNIASLILTSKKVTVEDAFIKNAMVDSVSAAKINTGILNTNLVNIQSEDGSLILNGTLQQFKDENGKVRIQMGKDAQGHFTFGIFDATGTGTLINDKGITENAIGSGLIVNDMINDNANINSSKLDVDSIVTSINAGTTSIKGSKIKLDTQNQTLDVAFNTLNTTVTNTGKTVGSQGTSIKTMQGEIETLITNTTITEDGNITTIKDAYSSLKQNVGEFGVALKEVEADFNNMTIGTRNLLSNSSPTALTGYSLNTPTNWKYELLDCSTSTKGKSIKCTNLVKSSGGVYAFPIKKDGLINGEYYTVSVMIRSSSGTLKVNFSHEQMIVKEMKTIGTDWQLTTLTSKVDTSKTSKAVVIYVDMNSINVGDWFEFHSLMLEKSTKPSNYTEAPEDIQSSIDSLGTRVKTAESNLTLDGLKTIIGNSYITPDKLDSKGYATTSDVTQSATNLIAKFSTSGGYNKLYNGNFRNGLTYWTKYGNVDSVVATTLSCPDNMYGIDMPGQLGKTNYYAQEFPYDRIGKLTLSYWTHLTLGGENGTTNPYSNIQVVIYYTDGTTGYLTSKAVSKFGTWEKIEFTVNIQQRPNKIKVELINRDTTKRLYFTNIMLEDGEISNGFTINPNESYDGIIDMGRDGVIVKQSNYNGYTAMRPYGFTVNDGKADVIKCSSDGLYVKGQIHVTSGSISEGALAGTLIDGQYIKTGTIQAQSIQIGDFTNYFTTPTNYTTNAKYPAYAMNPSTGQIFVSNPITHFNGGEKFLATGFVYAPTTNGSTTNFNLEFVWRDENGGFISASALPKPVAPNTQITLNDEITIPTRPANAKYGDFKIFCGNSAYSLVYSQPCLRMMMSGSLIVDGAIDGRTIRGAEIIGGEIKSIAVNEAGNPIFSLSPDGKIVGGYIECYGLSVDGEMSATTLNIQTINCAWYPQSMDEDTIVYINTTVTSATDWFDGAKYSSLEDMYAVMPRNLNGYTLFIIFETDYNGNIHLSRFNSGACYLYLQKHTIRGYIYVYGQSMRYAIYGNQRGIEGGIANCADIKPPKGKSQSGYAYTIGCDYCSLTCYDLNIYPGVDTTVEPSGIIVTNFSKAYLSNINAVGNPKHLVRSHSSSHVYVAGSSGLTTSNTFSAVSGSLQMLNKTTQAGTTTTISEVYTSGNAQIFKDGVTFTKADNSGSNDSGSSTTETISVTLKATSGDTYRRSVYKSWKNDGSVRQGDWGYGDCDGFWFFGSQLSNYKDKNITKVQITIKRLAGAGYSYAVQHTLVGHKYTNKPSGTPEAMGSAIRSFSLPTGDSVTLNLTASEIAVFKNYKGIGLKSAYDASHYSNCSSACTVKITYTE